MDPWRALETELDTWAAIGKVADLWWRDDDAVAVGQQFDRLVSVTETTGLLLAVIPLHATEELAAAVTDAAHVKVAQHGYAHINHADREQGVGAWELGLHRGEQVVLDELDQGRARLELMFPDDYIPVIVPPWNRIDPALFMPAARRGYRGVSVFGAREMNVQANGFYMVNCHSNPLRWKTGAKFKGPEKTISELVEHLANRRTGAVDPAESTGYLTHHLDMNDDAWAFSKQLVEHINKHTAALWRRDVATLFEG